MRTSRLDVALLGFSSWHGTECTALLPLGILQPQRLFLSLRHDTPLAAFGVNLVERGELWMYRTFPRLAYFTPPPRPLQPSVCPPLQQPLWESLSHVGLVAIGLGFAVGMAFLALGLNEVGRSIEHLGGSIQRGLEGFGSDNTGSRRPAIGSDE